jgi:hypothetical protein
MVKGAAAGARPGRVHCREEELFSWTRRNKGIGRRKSTGKNALDKGCATLKTDCTMGTTASQGPASGPDPATRASRPPAQQLQAKAGPRAQAALAPVARAYGGREEEPGTVGEDQQRLSRCRATSSAEASSAWKCGQPVRQGRRFREDLPLRLQAAGRGRRAVGRRRPTATGLPPGPEQCPCRSLRTPRGREHVVARPEPSQADRPRPRIAGLAPPQLFRREAERHHAVPSSAPCRSAGQQAWPHYVHVGEGGRGAQGAPPRRARLGRRQPPGQSGRLPAPPPNRNSRRRPSADQHGDHAQTRWSQGRSPRLRPTAGRPVQK